MTRQEIVEKFQEENPFLTGQQMVYQVVLHEILAMELKSGEKINQSKLSSDLNLSRGPVKAALDKLTEDGFVSKDKTGAFFVTRKTGRFTTNILAFKRQLDLLAVSHAVYNMSEKHNTQAKQQLRNMEQALKENSISMFCESDVEFHFVFAQATENPLLIDTYHRYRKLFFFHNILTYELGESFDSRMIHIHRKIFKAVYNHDKDEAIHALNGHYSSIWI